MRSEVNPKEGVWVEVTRRRRRARWKANTGLGNERWARNREEWCITWKWRIQSSYRCVLSYQSGTTRDCVHIFVSCTLTNQRIQIKWWFADKPLRRSIWNGRGETLKESTVWWKQAVITSDSQEAVCLMGLGREWMELVHFQSWGRDIKELLNAYCPGSAFWTSVTGIDLRTAESTLTSEHLHYCRCLSVLSQPVLLINSIIVSNSTESDPSEVWLTFYVCRAFFPFKLLMPF